MSDKEFQDWWRGVLPNTPEDTRARAWKFLEALMDLRYHELALARAWGEDNTAQGWGYIAAFSRMHPAFKAEYDAVKDIVEVRQQMRRMSEADRRAMEGWLEPVFGSGPTQGAGVAQERAGTVVVGHVRKFSDRLLELQLKAGDRAKYGDNPDALAGLRVGKIVINYNTGIDRSTPPESVTKASQRGAIEAEAQQIDDSDADN